MKRLYKVLIFLFVLTLAFFGKPVFAFSYLDDYEELSVSIDEAENSFTIKNNSADSIVYWKSKDLFDNKIIRFMPGDTKTFNKLLPEQAYENYQMCRKKQIEFDFENVHLIKNNYDFWNKYEGYKQLCRFDKEILKSDGIDLDMRFENFEHKSYLKDYIQLNHITNNSNKKLYIITVNNSLEQITEKYKQQDTTMFKSREKMAVLSFTGIGMWIYAPIWILDELVSIPLNHIKDSTAKKNKDVLPDSIEVTELLPQEKITVKSASTYIRIYEPETMTMYYVDSRKYP